ncbi:hypothetical protein [Nocardiopsis halotolerans]|uniref:hypothetical protein n=1 Tax=Nocardiopsis halotolerans TaxID=124252 RepID=UPI000347C450|nr:hypothetical protein [Nocardiopsis halotolerans]
MPRSDSPSPPPPLSRARLLLAALVLAAFAALLALRINHWGGLDQTALFYVGLPATIALLVVLTVRARSAMGVTMAVTTLGLTLAGPLLGEGMVCLLIAAPLIYGIVAVITWMARALVEREDRSRHALFAVPLLFALALEGVAGTSLLPREDSGGGGVLVPASARDVAEALAAPPEYRAPDALLLRAVPFPRPVSASGEGLEVGDTRLVRFTPHQDLRVGTEPSPCHMALRIVESEVRRDGGRVVFEVVEDTAFATWMDMRRAEAVWRTEDGGTRLTWSIDYERTYEPSWYFGPLQAYATDLAAGYLAGTFGAAASGRS